MLKTALMFNEHMTLQRDKALIVWGSADPFAKIRIQMQKKETETYADDKGNWRAVCGPYQTSFAETMRIETETESLVYEDVQVGEVWIAGGQSNMEFQMRYDAEFEKARMECTNPDIRFFDYPKIAYPEQIHEADYGKCYGFWRKADPDDLERFSAVAYWFARELYDRLCVPIGIIGVNWGGTPAAAWMSEEAIREGGGSVILDEYEEIVSHLDLNAYEEWYRSNPGFWKTDQLADPVNDILMYGGTMEEVIACFAEIGIDMSDVNPDDFKPVIGPKHERRPCGLYESMLKEVKPYTARGVIWYQGETDGDTHPELYETLFPALIRDWRRLWQEELPFLFVQIAPLEQWLDCIGKRYTEIRRAQQKTADTVENTGMAVITDAGMRYDIHPKQKRCVGYRLALLAENKVYGMDVPCEAPVLTGGKLRKGMAVLTFENVYDGLNLCDDTDLSWLKLSQNNAAVGLASAAVSAQNNTVTIVSDLISGDTDLYVRIAETGWYRADLYNSAGIPVRPCEITLGADA